MPVYKLWQSGPLSEAWYQLSPEEQQKLLGKVAGALTAVGGKELVLCEAGWSNEEWPLFGLEEFPDIEAVQRHQQLLAELEWARYGRYSRTTLGTPWVPPGGFPEDFFGESE